MISIGKATAAQINLVSLVDALEEHNTDPLQPARSKKKPWEMIYDPDQLIIENEELRTQDFKLS